MKREEKKTETMREREQRLCSAAMIRWLFKALYVNRKMLKWPSLFNAVRVSVIRNPVSKVYKSNIITSVCLNLEEEY